MGTQIARIMQIGTDLLFAKAHGGRGPQIRQINTGGLSAGAHNGWERRLHRLCRLA